MSYSRDLRKRVLNFIEAGGTKVEAAKRSDRNHLHPSWAAGLDVIECLNPFVTFF